MARGATRDVDLSDCVAAARLLGEPGEDPDRGLTGRRLSPQRLQTVESE